MGHSYKFSLILAALILSGCAGQMRKDPETLEEVCALPENWKYEICQELD